MIVITGTARLADPAGRDTMTEAVTAMVAATRAEAGCQLITYGFGVEDPDVMTFHEVYDDMAAMQAHMGAAHMKAFYDAAGPLMGGRPDVKMWVNAEEGQMGPG